MRRPDAGAPARPASQAAPRALTGPRTGTGGNRAVTAALRRVGGAPTTPVVQRAAGLPFDSHAEIHHNLLTSREFQLSSGEGVIVELKPQWFPEDDTPFNLEH